MKIVHIYREKNKGSVGGLEHHIRYVAIEQLKLGHVPVVFCLSFAKTQKLSKEVRNNIEYYHLELNKPPLFKWINNTFSFLSNKGALESILERVFHNFYIKRKLEIITILTPDVIHQHDYLASIRLSNKLSKKYKIVFTNHSGEYLILKKTKVTHYLQIRFLKYFDIIIASGKDLLPDLDHCYQIFNGVDTSLFQKVSPQKKIELKQRYNLNNKIAFLCARRWAPTKGVIYFAKALQLLESNVKKNIVVLFAGNESDDFDKYKLQVKRELEKCNEIDIRYLGNIKHHTLSQLINAIDVGVIPSLMEGISLFSVELASSGIPVLGTNVGGIPEVITHQNNGWIIPPANPIALANQITKIVTNWPQSNLNFEVNVFNMAYSWETITKKIVALYKLN